MSASQKIVACVQIHGIGQVELVACSNVAARAPSSGRSPTTWSRQLGKRNLNQRNVSFCKKSCDVAQTKKSKQTFPLPVIFLHSTTRCQVKIIPSSTLQQCIVQHPFSLWLSGSICHGNFILLAIFCPEPIQYECVLHLFLMLAAAYYQAIFF